MDAPGPCITRTKTSNALGRGIVPVALQNLELMLLEQQRRYRGPTAATDNKHEQAYVVKENMPGADEGDVPGADKEDTPRFALSHAPRRQAKAGQSRPSLETQLMNCIVSECAS